MAMFAILCYSCLHVRTASLGHDRRVDLAPVQLGVGDSVSVAQRDRPLAAACSLLVIGLLIGPLAGCRSIRERTAREDKRIAARELTRLGRDAMQRGRWREAAVKFEHAIQAHSSDPATHRHYAHTLWSQGTQDEAIEHLQRAVKLAGGEATWLAELGRMHMAQKRDPEAMRCAEQALAIDRHMASGWHLKASLQRRQGQLEEALASYHRAVTLQPKSAELRLELAELYRELGRPRRALSTLQRVVELYAAGEVPADVLHLRGLAFKALDRHNEAARAFAEAAAKKPAPDTIFELAQSHFRAGRIDEARQVAYQGIADNGEAPQLIALLHHLEIAASPQNPEPSGSPEPYNHDNRQLPTKQWR